MRMPKLVLKLFRLRFRCKLTTLPPIELTGVPAWLRLPVVVFLVAFPGLLTKPIRLLVDIARFPRAPSKSIPISIGDLSSSGMGDGGVELA